MENLSYSFVALLILVTAPIVSANEPGWYIASYSTLLSKHVEQGEKEGIKTTLVDYKSWKESSLHGKALNALQQINPELLSGKEKMAFWINAYNLLTIDLIIKTGETESIRNQGGLFKSVWKSHDWKIHNKHYTLDEIEHQILRPMGDPRIHMAINCASLSCPDLRAEPFGVETLDVQLEEQVILFLQNQSKGVKPTGSGLEVSEIFKWFSDDFGDEQGVIDFIHSRLPKSASANQKVEYFDYDWRLNGT